MTPIGNNRPERLLQRIEPRLERFPLLEARAADRPPHLFGAGGADGAGVFVEGEAGRIKRQVEKLEQSPDLGFGVINQILVDHPVDMAGEHGVEMAHEGHIIAVIVP